MTERCVWRLGSFLVVIGVLLAACGSSSSSSSGGGSSASSSLSSSSVGPGSAFCSDAKSSSDATARLNGLGSTATLDQVKSGVGAGTAALDTLDGEAPADIAADLHKFRTVFDSVNSQIQAATSLSQLQKILAQAPSVSTERQHIDSYVQSHCGFTPSGGGGAAASAPAAQASAAPTP